MKIDLLILFVLLFVSCNSKTENSLIDFKPNKPMEKLLKFFVAKNPCNDCLYEVYIDKYLPDIYHITLYRGKISLTQKENEYNNQSALGRVIVNNKEFHVFSGAEHYLNNSKTSVIVSSQEKIDSLSKNINYTDVKIWIAVDSAGIVKIKEYNRIAYPFVPLPLDEYHAPKTILKDIQIKKEPNRTLKHF
jgi:hypothetical protein